MDLVALSWNLFHGRDFPPEEGLRTWRSRLLRRTERSASHAQVNRDLYAKFSSLISSWEWDVALLQECPPRWAEQLAVDCGAEPHLALTSRNLPVPSLQRLGARINPDLIASWEGGSNLILVRTSAVGESAIVERRSLNLAARPERRVMAFSRLRAGLCVANLHASAPHRQAERELPRAAAMAVEWAGGEPLLFGGDFNIRPARSSFVFDALERDFGLHPRTPGDAIDHLLVRGLDVVEAPAQLPPEDREVPDPTAEPGSLPLPIRLSDHAPVFGRFALPQPAQSDDHP
ncbi:MAG: endonuclease/exonuclease/phosphatase family protein [Solirubrobacterales bacterium]|nr:endonuclease/exonuclease/phosphatase family protein [Solirubrobacterales bacterium]